ncbi:MAG TPA: AraC family transcriptional regulator [Spirochaetota bacterium]
MSASENINEVKKAVSFIESNLKSGISFRDVMDKTHYSDFHFLRLFKKMTGYPVIDYLRKRRLSAAAEELCRKNMRVIDIAYEYNFSHEQSFIRAFGDEFGITPGMFRRHKVDLHIFPRTSFHPALRRNNASSGETLVLSHGMKLIGIKRKINYAENSIHSLCRDVTAEFMNDWLPKIRECNPDRLYAFDEKIPGDPEHFITMPCVQVPDGIDPPDHMDCVRIPFHLASFNRITIGKNITEVDNTDIEWFYKHIYEENIPASPYSHITGYDYSFIDRASIAKPISSIQIFLPVVEKNF